MCTYFCQDTQSCDYILIEEKRRDCPPGDECTKFKKCETKKHVYKHYNSIGEKRGRRAFDHGAALILYYAGRSDKEIAKELHANYKTIQAWRRRKGLPRNKKVRSDD